MQFIIQKKSFLQALTTVSHAISNFSPLPAFSGIKIDVEMNQIKLTASDSDISILTSINPDNDNELEIKEMGSIVIEAKYILDIVRKFDDDLVTIDSIDEISIIISCNTSKFEINGITSSEYPDIDFSKPKESFMIDKNELKKAINQTYFAASDKDMKPILTGVNFKCIGNQLHIVATDSYRLAKKIIQLDNEANFNITIPCKSLIEINKIIEGQDKIEIAVSNKKIQIYIDDTLFQSRLIDGTYPETDRLIPNDFQYELSVDYQELITAIDRANFIKNDGISIIRLSLSNEECVLSSRNNQIGSCKQSLNTAKFVGEPLILSFNGKYVFDACKAINCKEISFHFKGEMRSFIIDSKIDNSLIQLVLPLKTNNYY